MINPLTVSHRPESRTQCEARFQSGRYRAARASHG